MRWFTGEAIPSLRDRPWVPIASAPDGARVRLIGRVVFRDRAIVAPLSGRRCVMWSLAIEETVLATRAAIYRDSSNRAWLQRVADQGATGFDLEDDTGRVHVDVSRLIVWACRDFVRRQWPFGASGALRRVLERYDSARAPLRQAWGTLRAREGVIRPGDEIAIEGVSRWVSIELRADARGYRAPGRTRRLVIEADEEAVHATNDATGPY